ncbi:hypothetical protein M569_09575, partial [Genlisea aurea]
VCDLPFGFFTNPQLMPVLASTLVAASYGCEQNKAVILQELSLDMLVQSLRTCKTTALEDSTETETMNQIIGSDAKSPPAVNNNNRKSSSSSARVFPSRSGNSSVRTTKQRRETKFSVVGKCNDPEIGRFENYSPKMLHFIRFPVGFIDKVEQFFASEICISSSHAS